MDTFFGTNSRLDMVWRMAEGNPKSDMELSGEITKKVVSVDE